MVVHTFPTEIKLNCETLLLDVFIQQWRQKGEEEGIMSLTKEHYIDLLGALSKRGYVPNTTKDMCDSGFFKYYRRIPFFIRSW